MSRLGGSGSVPREVSGNIVVVEKVRKERNWRDERSPKKRQQEVGLAH